MYKKDLTLNNQQWLICHKTKPNQTKYQPCLLVWLSMCWLYFLLGGNTPQKKNILYMILVLRFQLWNSGLFGVPLHCHYTQVHSNRELLYLFGSNRFVLKFIASNGHFMSYNCKLFLLRIITLNICLVKISYLRPYEYSQTSRLLSNRNN